MNRQLRRKATRRGVVYDENYAKILETLKKDPIIEKWDNNYKKNMENQSFSKIGSRPLSYLNNVHLYEKSKIVLIAAGPSVDKNINFLKNYQNNCIIICVDVVLFKLIENDIKPDFVVTVDPSALIGKFWKNIDTTQLTLVCPTTASPESIREWKGNMIFYNQSDRLGEPKGDFLRKLTKNVSGFGYIFNSFFVGATAYLFSLNFRPSLITLVGYDFAFSDNKSHCDGFLEIRHDNDKEWIKEYYEKLFPAEKQIKVDFPNGGSIFTSNTLNLYKSMLLQIIKSAGVSVINATEGGILTEVPTVKLSEILEKEYNTQINKIDIFNAPLKRKRKRR